MQRPTRLLILLIALAPACAPKVTVPSATKGSIQQAVISPEQTIPKRTDTWTFSPTNNTQQYHSITKTRFQLDDPDGLNDQDTLAIITEFSAKIDQLHTPVIITGHVDNILISSGPRIGIDPEKITFPIDFNGTVASGKLTLDITPSFGTSFNSNRCSALAQMVLGDIRTAIAIVPSLLQLHSTWTDTITTTTCTGREVSSDLKIVRSYTVIGEFDYAGMFLVLVRRAETTHTNGTGTQGQHQIILKGQGSGSSDLYLNPRTGLVIIINARHDSKIAINTSGHLQHFSQHFTQKITIQP